MSDKEGRYTADGGLTWRGKLMAVEEQERLRQYRRPRGFYAKGAGKPAPPTEVDPDPKRVVGADDWLFG